MNAELAGGLVPLDARELREIEGGMPFVILVQGYTVGRALWTVARVAGIAGGAGYGLGALHRRFQM